MSSNVHSTTIARYRRPRDARVAAVLDALPTAARARLRDAARSEAAAFLGRVLKDFEANAAGKIIDETFNDAFGRSEMKDD